MLHKRTLFLFENILLLRKIEINNAIIFDTIYLSHKKYSTRMLIVTMLFIRLERENTFVSGKNDNGGFNFT